MALTMMDEQAARKDRTEWPAALREEFAREARSPNGCVGSELVSDSWTAPTRRSRFQTRSGARRREIRV
jgi:hypothetical protein